MISKRKIRIRTLLYRLVLPMMVLFLCAFSTHSFGQYTTSWDNLYGSDNFDELIPIIEVEDGIVYGGSASDSTMGDAPPTSGSSDYWIYKTDFDGNILWSYVYGGVEQEALQNLIRTQDGGFIATGFSFSNASGFKSQDSRGERDVWLLKLDANGLFEWEATFGGDQEDYATKIVQAQDGTYYFGGWTQSLATGEVSEPSRGGRYDFWLCHIDTNGDFLYDRRFGGDNDDQIFDMIQLSNGDLLLGGLSNSNSGGEKTENSYGGKDAWLIRMTNTGTIIWDKTFGGTFDDRGSSFLELPNNQILIGGNSASAPGGNKTAPNIGADDYWLIKIEPNGDIIWDRTYGGTGSDELSELKMNDKGILYLGGRSNSNINGDKTEANRGEWDYWMIVLDENDVVYYDKTLGGNSIDNFGDFILLDGGGIVAGGTTASNTGSDITDVSNGLNDAWVVKLDCILDNFLDLGLDDQVCPNTGVTLDALTGQPNVCAYLWDDGSTDPLRDVLITEDVSFRVTVTDIFGCLGIDTIYFTTLDAPEFDLGPNLIICEDDSETLDATLDTCPTCTYLWDDNSTNPIRTVSPLFNTTYEVAITNDSNCTTTDQITVNVIANSINRINDVTCDPLEERNDTIFSMNQFGCDSLTIFNIILLASDTLRFPVGVCDSTLVGRDTIFDTNMSGCDSLNIFTYFQLPSSQTNLTEETCDMSQVGIDTTFLTNEFDCDSLVITVYSPLPSSENIENFLSCDPEDVGRDTIMLTNQFGCDSIIINVTTELRSDTTRLNEPVCFSDEVRMDTLILDNEVDCDSLVITNFFLVASDTIVTMEFSCDPMEVKNDSILVSNPVGCDTLFVDIVNLAPSSADTEVIMTCDVNQVLRDTIFETNIFGCDSIIYQEFQILINDTLRLEDYVCDGAAFSDTLFLHNALGCDSLIITDFMEASSDELAISEFTCDESMVGVQVFSLTNQFGCDSIVTIDFEFIEEQITIVEQNTCNPAQFMPDTLVFSTPLCDSVVIINYNVQETSLTTLNLVSCDMQDVGEFTSILTNQQGCDSVVTQIITFAEVDFNAISLFECSRLDTLIEEFNFTNQFGCDSIVVQTTFPGLDTTFLLSNVCEVEEEFRIEDSFLSIEGCDSIVVSIGELSESFETTFEIFTCDEEQVGVNSFTYTSAEGCDSIVVFNTLLGEIGVLANIRDIPCGESNNGQVSLEGFSGQPPYTFSFDGSPFGTTSVFNDLAIGIYQVGIQDADGCEAFEDIEVSEVTGVEIVLPDFIQLEFGDPISLNPIINGDFTEFYWTGIDSLFCETCQNQNYTPLSSTTLNFNVLSVDGCLEKHQVIIAVSKNYDVYIPNAFSPNGDNINDFFTVFGKDNISSVLSLSVYSRWGEQMFFAEDFDPNVEIEGWDGKNNGVYLNPGIFVYSAKVLFVDGEIRNFSGDLSLIR